jgi:hypothetical protein
MQAEPTYRLLIGAKRNLNRAAIDKRTLQWAKHMGTDSAGESEPPSPSLSLVAPPQPAPAPPQPAPALVDAFVANPGGGSSCDAVAPPSALVDAFVANPGGGSSCDAVAPPSAQPVNWMLGGETVLSMDEEEAATRRASKRRRVKPSEEVEGWSDELLAWIDALVVSE